MRRQRATIADNLSQVIGVIELGRRTGLLSVERDDWAGLEEGDIYFVEGQAVYACTGAKSGRIALEALRAWGACRFAFLSNIPQPTPNISPQVQGARPAPTGPMRPAGPPSRPMPGYPQRSGPVSGPQPAPPRSGALPFSALPPAPAQDALQRGQDAGSWPQAELASAAPLPAIAPYQRPKRAPNAQDIPRLAASYELSWAHRAVLLLADGEHTVADLARRSGRSETEVLRLLADLIRLGLITLLS